MLESSLIKEEKRDYKASENTYLTASPVLSSQNAVIGLLSPFLLSTHKWNMMNYLPSSQHIGGCP